MNSLSPTLFALFLSTALCGKNTDAIIQIDAASNAGPVPIDWAWVGHDEINYAFYPGGRRLLQELNEACPVPVFIRGHNLMNSGDNEASLKWSASNVYTEDASGQSVYRFDVIDRIFDTYLEHDTKPLVQFGFMPEALNSRPDLPYERDWPNRRPESWAYPPNDYQKWADLVEVMVRHWVDRYGKEESLSWLYEPWNEPAGNNFWRGTDEEYFKLYDYTVDAVRRALPGAIVGGPHVQSLVSAQNQTFMRAFLEHCRSGTNYATGETGSPIDFLAFHTKGNVAINAQGLVQMGSLRQVKGVDEGFRVIAEFPEFSHLPIILGESDPEGTAAYSVAERPQNAYRHSAIYPAYMASLNHKFRQSASLHGVYLEGIVSWAFTFPEKPWFAGYRALSTHSVDKPVMNYFRMSGMMTGHLLETESNHAVALDKVLRSGYTGKADIDAMAARNGNSITILVWHYHDLLNDAEDATVDIQLDGLPPSADSVLVEHFLIDDHPNRNSFLAWQSMGSPQPPSESQIEKLQRIGQLQLIDSPRWVAVNSDALVMELNLPRPSLSLLRLSW